MSPPDDRFNVRFENRTLIVLLVIVTLAMGWILLPFYGTVLWATIIALLFAPLQRLLVARLNGRRTLAALVTLLAVLLIVILPFVGISAALAREATGVYKALQAGELQPGVYLRHLFDTLPGWLTALLDRFGLVDFATLQQRVAQYAAKGSQFVATQALAIGQNTFELVVGLFITLYLAFFLIRDGASLACMLRRATPLDPEHNQALAAKFATVIRATVRGNLVVAVIQGLLGGLAFGVLGIRGALLWAVLMAFLSLLPAVGAGLVWVPVALYLFIAGQTVQAVGLVLWGVLVIGLVDNLLRPVLVGKDTRMPDYVVLISTLGGIATFGINGFVIGPAIAAMFMAVWQIFTTTRRSNGD